MERRRTRFSRESCPRTPRIVINVSGQRFVTHMEWLKRLPDTLLGSEIISKFYDGARKEYFFDRDPHIFRYILNYYCTGKLHASPADCLTAFRDELEFFGISESEVEDCCWVSLNGTHDIRHHYAPKERDRKISQTAQNLDTSGISSRTNYDDRCSRLEATTKAKVALTRGNERVVTCFAGDEEMNTTRLNNRRYPNGGKFRRKRSEDCTNDLRCQKLATTQETPRSTLLDLLNRFYGLFIVLSIVVCVVETVECSVGKRCEEQYPEEFFAIDTFFVTVFSLELLTRFALSPRRPAFFKDFFNIIDLLAILPYYVNLLLVVFTDVRDAELEAFRVLRVFRVMKLTRRSLGLKSLLFTIRNCYTDLLFMYFTFTLGIFLFASVLYYTEGMVEHSEGFKNIADSSWYACVTMMTTGYGDVVPYTVWGKIIGGICGICGVIIMSLPIPIMQDKKVMVLS